MNNPYDLHTWSTQYPQERLQEAQAGNLPMTTKVDREAANAKGRATASLGRVLSSLLAAAAAGGAQKVWR